MRRQGRIDAHLHAVPARGDSVHRINLSQSLRRLCTVRSFRRSRCRAPLGYSEIAVRQLDYSRAVIGFAVVLRAGRIASGRVRRCAEMVAESSAAPAGRFFPGASRRSCMRRGRTTSSRCGVRPQPAAAVSAGLHPTVECRSRARRGSAPRAHHGAYTDRFGRHGQLTSMRFADRLRAASAILSSSSLRSARTRRFTRTSQSSIRRRWRSSSGMLEQQLLSGPFLLITAGSV